MLHGYSGWSKKLAIDGQQPTREGLLRQVDPRRILRLYPARVQVQARAAGWPRAWRGSNLPLVPCLREEAGNPAATNCREKLFCNKWIHDGPLCFHPAKAQYEIPHDRGTQEELGRPCSRPSCFRWYHSDEPSPLSNTTVLAAAAAAVARRFIVTNGFMRALAPSRGVSTITKCL
jgi:hypothetical protein